MHHGLGELCQTGPAEFFTHRKTFCTPGYWAPVIARARATGLTLDVLNLSEDHYGYLRAMRAECILGMQDTHPYPRVHKGKNYSPFVLLESTAMVDEATSTMQSCVRELLGADASSTFIEDLCDVVGDLHDNVWSHALAPGLSLAQRWGKTSKPLLEFALADCGMGFLAELHRAGVAERCGIRTDEDAIKWCILEGNTSKPPASDDWAQRVPEDVIGNPMPGIGAVMSDNHHLGLGLAKLVNAVKTFRGKLWLVSGSALLHINPEGTESYVQVRCPWQGVALACRFNTAVARAKPVTDPAVELIEQLLR